MEIGGKVYEIVKAVTTSEQSILMHIHEETIRQVPRLMMENKLKAAAAHIDFGADILKKLYETYGLDTQYIDALRLNPDSVDAVLKLATRPLEEIIPVRR